MDAPQTNLGPEPKAHVLVMVILTIIITLIIGGGGVYAWQYMISQEKDAEIQRLGEQTNTLNTEVKQLQQQNNDLKKPSEVKEDNQVKGIGAVGPVYRIPYSIGDENHQALPIVDWDNYANQGYQYSFSFDSTVFNCEQDQFVHPFDPDNNKLPADETVNVNELMENLVSCVAIEPCVIESGFVSCMPRQIKIGIYPNSGNMTLNDFCALVANQGNDCSVSNYQIAGQSAIRNSFRLIPVDQPAQEEDSIDDLIYFASGDKNYLIHSMTGLSDLEGRRLIETMLSTVNFSNNQ